MNVTVVPADRLSPNLIRAWDEIQRADPALGSPYYRPEFTRLVDAARGGVEVAVMEEGGAPVGFFPIQRRRVGAGRPVSWPMADFQGAIVKLGVVWDPARIVRACGLTAWDFDHVPATQTAFAPHARGAARSPFLDLSAGYDAYAAARKRAGSELITNTLRKARKAEREVGPIRFASHTADPGVFAALLDWKRAQYARTGAVDLFALGWPLKLLEDVRTATGDGFAGVVSMLHIGDRLAAVHLGMRSHGVLHSWFPAYEPEFAKHSPGMVLLLEVAKESAAAGVQRLDLGRGEEEYKISLMSGATMLIEGSVAVTPRTRLLRGGWYRARDWAKTSRFAGPVRTAARATRPLREWLSFR